MVLQPELRSPSPVLHARREAHGADRPDPVRIVGISGTLLFNGALLLLMLVPLARYTNEPPKPKGIEAEWFEPRPVPPPPPPEVVPVERAATPPAPAAPAQRVLARDPAPVAAPSVIDAGGITADPTAPLGGSGDDMAAANPAQPTGMRLAYAKASAPPYPRDALRAAQQGTVVLQVTVDVDGRPIDVSVRTSSGHRRLDEAARRHVLQHWRFRPAMRDGMAVQAIGLVPVEFSLDRG